MDALQAICERRSIRAYRPEPVDREQLETLVDAGRLAPTARGVQPWEFVVVTDRPRLKELAALTDHGPFIADAAACIIVFCRETKYYLEDGCAAVENILLAAHALGLGACWVAGDKKPYADAVGELASAPGDMNLVALVPVGRPAESPRDVKKRPLEEVVHWEQF